MGTMPELRIRGTRFVLTGSMWMVRRRITQVIEDQGGYVDDRIQGSHQRLVVASNRLAQRNGKWYTQGTATVKVQSAIACGALVYHEKDLRAALEKGERVQPINPATGRTKTPARRDAPVWNDELQAQLDAAMDKTSELLAQF